MIQCENLIRAEGGSIPPSRFHREVFTVLPVSRGPTASIFLAFRRTRGHFFRILGTTTSPGDHSGYLGISNGVHCIRFRARLFGALGKIPLHFLAHCPLPSCGPVRGLPGGGGVRAFGSPISPPPEAIRSPEGYRPPFFFRTTLILAPSNNISTCRAVMRWRASKVVPRV